jgi:starvation-inducible outer membrane lipoprotein
MQVFGSLRSKHLLLLLALTLSGCVAVPDTGGGHPDDSPLHKIKDPASSKEREEPMLRSWRSEG